MKNIYLPLICGIFFLASCSSAYKTAQTPDDVYYSPGSQKQAASSGNDQYYNANSDDQYLMMKSQSSDPSRWSYFDDYASDNFYSPYYSPYSMYSPYSLYSPYSSFGFSPFGFGFYSGFGFSPYMYYGYGGYLNNYYYWNSLYNPYYGSAIVVTKYPATNYYAQLHPFALSNYTGTAINNANTFKTPTTSGSNSFRNHFTNSAVNNSNNFNNRFNSNNNNNNNNFFRSSQSTQSFRSSGGSFGGGGGGRVSFGRR